MYVAVAPPHLFVGYTVLKGQSIGPRSIPLQSLFGVGVAPQRELRRKSSSRCGPPSSPANATTPTLTNVHTRRSNLTRPPDWASANVPSRPLPIAPHPAPPCAHWRTGSIPTLQNRPVKAPGAKIRTTIRVSSTTGRVRITETFFRLVGGDHGHGKQWFLVCPAGSGTVPGN